MVRQQYFTFFVIVAVVGCLSYGSYNLLPANAIFELLVVGSLLFVAKRMPVKSWYIFAFCTGYFVVCMALALSRGAHPVDFLLAYKTYFYLAILCFFSAKVLFTSDMIKLLWRSMLLLFFVKYALSIVLNVGERPGIFTENNFEIMFLLLLGCAVWSLKSKLSALDWAMLGVVIFLSGSRSGVICFLAMMVLLYIKEMNWKTILQLGLVGIAGLGVVAIFVSRLSGGSVEDIDRVVFFQLFLTAIADWQWHEFLFGSPALTPLPAQACERLAFYKTLFSAKDPTICYSVILHSYVTRAIFDHGFIGLLSTFWVINTLLKMSDVQRRVRLSVLAILFLNGVSVSSVNSVYAVLGLIIVMTGLYPHRFELEKRKLHLLDTKSN
ncbi:hypothetical protein PA25_03860 [Pseudoalteromonas sp. A25]|uniref:hypothetical protein n=1 Tax=Pseudoalteromonas sp. A25 TaxID=116092 RepID=UPI0012608A14|nr:hypothetical protein [Pseudoalteromonas sp. A25]BBN80401.1 hypothetical protein PA25_03860 [Pseudoalteromonas sp. A25]